MRTARATSARMSPSTPSPSSGRSSEELALEAQRGSRDAFGELVARHEASLLAFLRGRVATSAEAEELAQEAFLRAWRKLATYDAERRFTTWLFTLARNLAVSHGRVRRVATIAVEDSSVIADGADLRDAGRASAVAPERALEHRESAENLWSLASAVLTRDQREALWLRYAEDLTADEIGVVLDRRAVAVRVLLFRARATMARHLEREHAAHGSRPSVARVLPREALS